MRYELHGVQASALLYALSTGDVTADLQRASGVDAAVVAAAVVVVSAVVAAVGAVVVAVVAEAGAVMLVAEVSMAAGEATAAEKK
jgi:hypothetical protein